MIAHGALAFDFRGFDLRIQAAPPQDAAAFLGGMFGGGGDGFDLEVTGDGSALATLVLVVDGKDVEPRSWMNFGRGTTYGFPAVKGDTVRVKAEFCTGQRTETVSF